MKVLLLREDQASMGLFQKYELSTICCHGKMGTDLTLAFVRANQIPHCLYVYDNWNKIYKRVYADKYSIEDIQGIDSFITLTDIGARVEPNIRGKYERPDKFSLTEDQLRFDQKFIKYIENTDGLKELLEVEIKNVPKGKKFVIEFQPSDFDLFGHSNGGDYIVYEEDFEWCIAK